MTMTIEREAAVQVPSFVCFQSQGETVEQTLDMLRRRVWERLVGLSRLDVSRYLGDWWHDAEWLRRWLDEDVLAGEPFRFFYAWRESGTSIGTDRRLVPLYNDHAIEVTVTYEPARRRFDMREVTL